eukprot:1376955-Amorphochlora_amoeboformis.AAC.1
MDKIKFKVQFTRRWHCPSIYERVKERADGRNYGFSEVPLLAYFVRKVERSFCVPCWCCRHVAVNRLTTATKILTTMNMGWNMGPACELWLWL